MRPRVSFFCIVSLAALLPAPLHGIGHLKGDVGINKIFETGEILSAGHVACETFSGDIDRSCAMAGDHWIANDSNSSQEIARRPVNSQGEYHGNVRGNPRADTCYRGRLQAFSWGYTSADETSDGLACGSPAQPPPPPYDMGCEENRCSPIVLDLDGGGFRFTDLESGVLFDLDADGSADPVAWTEPEGRDAFLVLDRNGNGEIDDGRELFGGVTDQPASDDPNGFIALRVFDEPVRGGNGDGWISPADAVFPLLRLWVDADHDGRSQGVELKPLSWGNVRAIDLDYVVTNRRDRHGNRLRWVSAVQFGHGRRYAAVDVLFLMD